MKKVIMLIAAAFILFSCGGPKTPVDELLNLLDDGAALLMTGKSDKDFEKAFEEKSEAIFENNKDYVLTSADKNKVVKKLSGLMEVAMKAAIKSGEIPESLKEYVEEQMDKQIDNLKDNIDEAETLGDLKNLFDVL